MQNPTINADVSAYKTMNFSMWNGLSKQNCPQA